VLRAYLAKWKLEKGRHFHGVGPKSTDEEFAAVAADHPVLGRAHSVVSDTWLLNRRSTQQRARDKLYRCLIVDAPGTEAIAPYDRIVGLGS
jgi:hypothetical protein